MLVSDYGRGVAADPVVRAALARAVARRVPVVWDPHPRGAAPVPGVTVVTPNLAEARGAGRRPTSPAPGVGAALALGADLVARWDVRAVAVTLGGRGAVVRHRHGACAAAPAPAVAETDPCGAGDHFAGGVAARLAAGATVDEAVADAVAGAAEFVARGGGAAVRRVGDAWCQPDAGSRPDPRPPRSPTSTRARALVARVRAAGGTVVATGGVFDPLHRGHADSLAAARALGDCLLVLVNSDASVRRRGGGAPRRRCADRVAALAALDGRRRGRPVRGRRPARGPRRAAPRPVGQGRRPRPGRPPRDAAGALVGRRGRRRAVPADSGPGAGGAAGALTTASAATPR